MSESWKLLDKQAPITDPRLYLVSDPMYRLGTVSNKTHRNKAHTRQTISWMTSSRHIAHVLSTNIATNHELHRRLRIQADGRLVPPHQMPKILRALQKQLDEDGVKIHSFSEVPTNHERGRRARYIIYFR